MGTDGAGTTRVGRVMSAGNHGTRTSAVVWKSADAEKRSLRRNLLLGKCASCGDIVGIGPTAIP